MEFKKENILDLKYDKLYLFICLNAIEMECMLFLN